jgi:hypothetical protein
MPLRTYLSGALQRIWDGGPRPPSLRRRTAEEVRGDVDAFRDQLEKLVAFRPEWDEEGPARDAKVFSLDNFAGPFQYARSQAYRRRLPVLCGLEAPQLWLPVEFEPVFEVAPPWNPESRLGLASAVRVAAELERLGEWMAEEDREDLAGPRHVAEQLRGLAVLGLQHRTPVVVEG